MATKLVEQVLETAIEVQQIPAPTFVESRRGKYVRDRFQAEGLSEVSVDNLGNVYGCLPGVNNGPSLVVSAHLDTVFPEGTDLSIRRDMDQIAAPGIGDNSLGVAGLFGLMWGLRQKDVSLPGDLWLVANVGEEGLGDLRGMRAVVDKFEAGVQAYIVLEGMALGQVYHRGLGVRRYRIGVHTAGGHSWADYGRPSAILELATLIHKFSILSLPKEPRTTLNVGVISGGTSVNTIAQDAYLELDLRSENIETLNWLAAQVVALVQANRRSGVQIEADLIGDRPVGAIASDHPLIQLAINCLNKQGIVPRLSIGSTDANVPLSRGMPAICIGLTTGGGAHTTDEYIHTQPLAKGLDQLLAIVEGAFQHTD